jgi:hypothetical protein
LAVYSLPFLGDRDLMLKQARCLFHQFNRQDACSTNRYRQDACSTNSTGKMPVPQADTGKMPVPQADTGKMPVPQADTGKMPVPPTQQARCLFHKQIQVSCGVGVPPAHQKLIDNPRCELG